MNGIMPERCRQPIIHQITRENVKRRKQKAKSMHKNSKQNSNLLASNRRCGQSGWQGGVAHRWDRRGWSQTWPTARACIPGRKSSPAPGPVWSPGRIRPGPCYWTRTQTRSKELSLLGFGGYGGDMFYVRYTTMN